MFARIKPRSFLRRRRPKALFVAFTVYGVRSFHCKQKNLFEASELLQGCKDFSSSVLTTPVGRSFPALVSKLFSLADQTYILSASTCGTVLPSFLARKAQCIHGQQIDSCVPPSLLQGRHQHAMKVTFSHAIILQLAQDAGYRHILVIEDDVTLLRRTLAEDSLQHFAALLQHSTEWSIIRFGYRPKFLEHRSDTRCPQRCRCTIDVRFGAHLCKLHSTGCDLRSSDMYIINSRFFSSFQKELFDLTIPQERRIVDYLPMQRISEQWLFVPQLSFQMTLDTPIDYQAGLGALYMTKCVGPRPLDHILKQQLFSHSLNSTQIT